MLCFSRVIPVALLTACLILIGGCSSPAPTDLVATKAVKLEQPPSDRFDLSPLHITRDDEGVVMFRGEVRRKDGDDAPTDEHVHLDIVDAKGEWVDQIALHWQPQTIPRSGERSATYQVQYFWTPPPGTTIRVSVADDSHDTLLSTGGGKAPAGGPSGVAGPPKGIYTPSPGGSPRAGATRQPGQPRQPSQPRTPGVPLGRGSGRGARR